MDLWPLDPNIKRDDEEGARAGARELAAWLRKPDAGPLVKTSVKESFSEYTKRWLTDRESRVVSIKDDASRLKHHILPVLGHLDVRTFNRDGVERLRDDLDLKIKKGFTIDKKGRRRTFEWKTAANIWTLFTGMCVGMTNAKKREFRVRGSDDNPCTNVLAPERGDSGSGSFSTPTSS